MFILEAITGLLSTLLVPGLIIYLVLQSRKKKQTAKAKSPKQILEDRYNQLSQWLFLVSILFLGSTLHSINQMISSWLSPATIVLIVALVGLAIAYRFKTFTTLVVGLASMVIWWVSQGTIWAEVANPDVRMSVVLFGGIGIVTLFYFVGRMLEQTATKAKFGHVFSILSVLTLTGFLVLLSSGTGLTGFEKALIGSPLTSSAPLSIAIFSIASAVIGLILYLQNQQKIHVFEALFGVGLIGLFASIMFMPGTFLFTSGMVSGANSMFNADLNQAGLMWAAIFNIVAFIELIGLVLLGYHQRSGWLVNIGVVFLFIFILMKYFDWFFKFLDKSLFFIGAGLLLFILGWFMEKGRRTLLSTIKDEV